MIASDRRIDARVCLSDIDNATRLVLARRGDGGGGRGFMEAGIGKFLKPVGEGGTQDPRFVIFSIIANYDLAEWRQSTRRLNP